MTVALLLLGGGLLWLLDSLDAVDVSPRGAMAAGLVVVGAALVVGAWRGRAVGLVTIAVLLAGGLVVDETFDVPLDAGVGDHDVVVDTAAELTADHDLLAGDMTLDLTGAALSRTRTTELSAELGLGEMRVEVPEGARVTAEVSVGAGSADWPGPGETYEDGADIDRTFVLPGEPGGPRLHLDLSVGVGTLEVVRG